MEGDYKTSPQIAMEILITKIRCLRKALSFGLMHLSPGNINAIFA